MEEKMIKHNNWNVQNEIFPLFKFVLPMFESIFGQAIMEKEQCTIYIDMTCVIAPLTAFNPTRIILNVESCCFNQVIFQLAHELTHYAVRQNTDYQYTNCAIAAFEEPAAEAMSLYILKLCAEHWVNCDFYQYNLEYAKSFETYRVREYNKASGTKPNDYGEWTSICNGFTGYLTSDSQRPNVSAMRNALYDAFVQFPDDIGLFIKYPLYMRSIPYEKLIDEPAWKTAEPSKTSFITSICAVQPVSM